MKMAAAKNKTFGPGVFSASELEPATGFQKPVRDDATKERVAIAVTAIRNIYVPTEPIERAIDRIHTLYWIARHTPPDEPMPGLCILGPSGASKSLALRLAGRRIEEKFRRDPDDMPVAGCRIDAGSTSRQVMASMLKGIGETFTDAGNEFVLRDRFVDKAKDKSLKLYMLDEIDNAPFGGKSDSTQHFKVLQDTGGVALVFAGVDDVRATLRTKIQFGIRQEAPCDLMPLSQDSQEDRRTFRKFCKEFDEAIVEHGLIKYLGGFDDNRFLYAAYIVSGGNIGRVAKLVRAALGFALERHADRIEPHNLSRATQEWAMPVGLIDYDPFRYGRS